MKRLLKGRCFLILSMSSVLLVPVVALAFAPYLPRLLLEGYPSPRWPAHGYYAGLPGSYAAVPLRRSPVRHKPNAWALKLFRQYKGKALLVFHEGRLKLEYYAPGMNAQTKFNSYSMAKSLVGALILKAHAEGLIGSLDDQIGDYLPRLGDQAVHRLPIRSLLRMRSGLAFESEGKRLAPGLPLKQKRMARYNPFGKLVRLHMTGLSIVSQGLHANPARIGQYNYQNINTAILGALLTKIYRQPLEKILSDKLWKPAGAGGARWRRYDRGKPVSPYCCIYASARDWLRIGIFLANNGSVGTPFLPKKLWNSYMNGGYSTAELSTNRYGLHVYHNILDRQGQSLQGRFTFAFGNMGQVIYMMPDKDFVVVRLGERVAPLHSTLYAVWRSIIAAMPGT